MRPRVVVVGAGFAGLNAARRLGRAPVDTLVVDQHNFHLFTPLLYQVASSLLEPAEIAQPIPALLRPVPNADFKLARVESVDLSGRMLGTDRGPLAYDYLVLAAGSVNHYFGVSGMAERSLNLKDMESALQLRNHVLGCFEECRWTPDPEVRRRLLTFTVVGGGPTGIEYAGALCELASLVLRRDFKGAAPAQVVIDLVEAADHLLEPFDPVLRERARRQLEKRGVRLKLSTRVHSLDEHGLELADGARVAAATVIWAAGVGAAPLAAGLGLPLGHDDAVKVLPTLQLPGHPEVFVTGDMAAVEAEGQPLPMLATVAIQEGKHVGDAIRNLAAGLPAADFRYHDPGIMATIGRNAAVAQIGGARLSGFPGWLVWLVVHLVRIVGLRNRVVVLVNWAWNYIRFDRPVRLILRAAGEDREQPGAETAKPPSGVQRRPGRGPGIGPASRL